MAHSKDSSLKLLWRVLAGYILHRIELQRTYSASTSSQCNIAEVDGLGVPCLKRALADKARLHNA